ncbi:hypothetical protein QG036_09880, partial [Kingella kingae]|nr:hypothetical protein [Kingella kingae]
SKQCHSGTETAENYAGAVSFFAGMIGKAVGGANPGVAIANALTGQGTWVTRPADLVDKIHNGTAKPTDYAEVAASTMSLLAGFGVLAGLANPWTLTAAAVANGALFTYNFFLKESPLCEKGAHDFNNINRNGKAHGYDPLILNLDGN